LENFNVLALVGLLFFDAIGAIMAYLYSNQLKSGYLKLASIALIFETARQVANITYIGLAAGDAAYYNSGLIELTMFFFFASTFFLLLAMLKMTGSNLISTSWYLVPLYILMRTYLNLFYEGIDQFSWYLSYLPVLACNAIIIWQTRTPVSPRIRNDWVLISLVCFIFFLRVMQPYFTADADVAWFGLIYFFDSMIFPAIGMVFTLRALELLNHRYRESREKESESQNNIEYVLNNAHEAIIGFNQVMIATTWNQRAQDITGYSPTDALNKLNVFSLLAYKDKKSFVNSLRDSSKRKENIFVFNGEITIIAKHGRRIPCEISIRSNRIGKEKNSTAIFKDITLQRQLKEDRQLMANRLQHAQKLESLGVLTGGIAHDFNNLLSGITGQAELALYESDSPSINEKLSLILTTSGKAAELTDQMLTYSGNSTVKKTDILFDSVIGDITDLLKAVISKKVELNIVSLEPALRLNADSSQLNQVVMNLVTNASDSHEGGTGSISVETGYKILSNGSLDKLYFGAGLLGGRYAYISVRDDGVGMSHSALNKLFDPFYSTKFPGRGLGMASVAGIIQNHLGAVQVESELENGTTITIYLPLDERRVVKLTEQEDKGNAGQTILIVEDEGSVRLVAKSILTNAGFKVLLATEGLAGLELFHAKHKEIDLVLLDCTLPHLSGSEFYQEMRTIKPNLPVLFYSGFNRSNAIPELDGQPHILFLQKPFKAERLLELVNNLLRQKDLNNLM
jgi:PAS domain S-box-containing protein